jgi:hypothetical protein
VARISGFNGSDSLHGAIIASYADFVDLGNPSNPAFYNNGTGGNYKISLDHCNFTRCAASYLNITPDSSRVAGFNHFSITDSTWAQTVDPQATLSGATLAGGSVYILIPKTGMTEASTFARNDVDGAVNFFNGAAQTSPADNVFRNIFAATGTSPVAAGSLTGNLHYWTDPQLSSYQSLSGDLVACAHASCYYCIDLGWMPVYVPPSGVYADLTVATATVKPSTASLAGYVIGPNDTTHSLVITHANLTTTIKIDSLSWNDATRTWDGWVLHSAPTIVDGDSWALNVGTWAQNTSDPARIGLNKIRLSSGTTYLTCVWDFEHTEWNLAGPAVECVWTSATTEITRCCAVGNGYPLIVGTESGALTFEHNTFNAMYWYVEYYYGTPATTTSTVKSNIFFGSPGLRLSGYNNGLNGGDGTHCRTVDYIPPANLVANVIETLFTPTSPVPQSSFTDSAVFNTYAYCCDGSWFSAMPTGFAATSGSFNTSPGSTTNANLNPQLLYAVQGVNAPNLAEFGRQVIGYTALGVASNAADYVVSLATVNYISATDRTMTRTTVIPWIQAQLAPTNGLLSGTAHDNVSPTNGWPGAVQGQATSNPFYSSYMAAAVYMMRELGAL